ncbi:hypothetical protein ACFYR1_11115 [Streptomyces canus]|uniref:hypothetical protein n=1 Tax=Streptomyces canus TaxID=58343 RepID=UPI00367BBDFE
MNREQALTEARNAADKARRSAEYVDNINAGGDSQGKVPRTAAAGALWADVARSWAAIAAATPETTTED